MQWIRTHLSLANLISMIALFVALGGTTYAAVALPKNSVGAKQIKKNARQGFRDQVARVGTSEVATGRGGAPLQRRASGDIADNGVGGANLARQLGRRRGGPPGGRRSTATRPSPAAADARSGRASFARVADQGSAQPNVRCPAAEQGNRQANVVAGEAGLLPALLLQPPRRPASALVSLDNADAAVANAT